MSQSLLTVPSTTLEDNASERNSRGSHKKSGKSPRSEKKLKKDKKKGAAPEPTTPTGSNPESETAPDTSEAVEHVIPISECPARKVTVYSNIAEVVRTVKAKVPAGNHILVVKGLPKIVPRTLRVYGGKGSATILDIGYRVQTHTDPIDQGDVTAKQECLKALRLQLASIARRVARLEKHKQLLVNFSNKLSAGFQDESSSAASLSAATSFLEYYRNALTPTNQQIHALNQETQTLTLEKKALETSLGEALTEKVHSWKEARITLSAQESTSVVIDISYHVTASWSPSYDLRVNSLDKRLEITYFGQVENNSGDDWDNVKLALSTVDLAIRPSCPKPELQTVIFSYDHTKIRPCRNLARKKERRSSIERDEASSDSDSDGGAGPDSDSSLKLAASYVIPHAVTIHSSTKSHKVTITNLSLDAKFNYFTVPRLDPTAYLKASAVNTTNYHLLAGPMNVFFDSNFVARSVLKGVVPTQKFESFLGSDPAVKVSYLPVASKNNTSGVFVKSNSRVLTHKTTIKNTKAIPVEVVVVDEYPASRTKDIKVKLLEPDLEKNSAVKLLPNNNLEWTVEVPSQKSLALPFSYTVEYPANANFIVVE